MLENAPMLIALVGKGMDSAGDHQEDRCCETTDDIPPIPRKRPDIELRGSYQCIKDVTLHHEQHRQKARKVQRIESVGPRWYVRCAVA